MNTIKIFKKMPGEDWQLLEIENTLESLQQHVGGYIEFFTVFSDVTFILNEEGILLDLPYNFTFLGHKFFGPVLFAAVSGEELVDFPKPLDVEVEKYLLKLLPT